MKVTFFFLITCERFQLNIYLTLLQVQFLTRVQLVQIQFSFPQTDCQTKVKGPCLLYYLLTRRDEFMPFPKLLPQSKMKMVLYRI